MVTPIICRVDETTYYSGRLTNQLRPYRNQAGDLQFFDAECNWTLSRRMNRLLARTYRKVIKDKLTRLEEKFGITTVEVNVAYTSQECFKCGFVSKRNRKSQSKFSCTCCGHKVNADVNAARNIIKRRSFDIELRRYAREHKVRITRCLILERLLHKHKSSCSNNLASCHL